eukprot:PRCOL_00000094-RA
MVTRARTAELMLPDHSNPAGNVHGGEILKLVENATWIAASRHVNAKRVSDGSGNDARAALVPALVRLEQMQFLLPAHVGEVMQLDAQVVFASARSLCVAVTVSAEAVLHGDPPRETNSALAWYVAYEAQGPDGTTSLAPQRMPPVDAAQLEGRFAWWAREAKRLYHARKGGIVRSASVETMPTAPPSGANGESAPGLSVGAIAAQTGGAQLRPPSSDLGETRAPAESYTELARLLLPSDCVSGGVCRGGVLLKLMDECAGVSAYRHARKAGVVTASVEAVDFASAARNGEVVRLVGQVAYASSRSLDVRVRVFVDHGAAGGEVHVASSHFIYVALDENGAVTTVAPLAPQTDAERTAFTEGEAAYAERKRKRKAEAQAVDACAGGQ